MVSLGGSVCGQSGRVARGRVVHVARSQDTNVNKQASPKKRGRSWGRGGGKRRLTQSLPLTTEDKRMPSKLSDVIMQLKADGTLPRGVSSPGYFDEFITVNFRQDAPRTVDEASVGGRPAVWTTFKVHAQVAFGSSLRAVGTSPELGAWSADDALSLSWTEGNWWEGTVHLPAGDHEFKFVVVKPSGGGQAIWEPCANRCLQAVEMDGAPLEYATLWSEKPSPLSRQQPVPVPGTPPPARTPAPATTQLQRTYNACRSVLAMFGAGSVNAVDIGANNWRPPRPPSAVTTDTLLDMVEAARLSKDLPVVTSQDADFVRKLGLGSCNLPTMLTTRTGHASICVSSDVGFASTSSSVSTTGHKSLVPMFAAATAPYPHHSPHHVYGRSSAAAPAPSRGVASFGAAAAPNGAGGSSRRRVISEATASAMQSVLGLSGEQQELAALGLQRQTLPRPQGVEEEEQSCRQVAAQLLADHLGLVGDAARLDVVVDSFAALAGRGFVPRQLGPVQYASWLARSSDRDGIWHAAVRCALAPLAELQPQAQCCGQHTGLL